MAAGNPSFDAVLATTLDNHSANLEDNIFKARPLTYWFLDKGRIRTKSGGVTIVEPLIYGRNDTFGSYSGYDTILTTPQDGITAAKYNWKQIAASIAISGLEEAQNSGEDAVLDLLEAKVMQTEESISDGLNDMLFADGTGNSSKDFSGLLEVFQTANTFGGIDRSDSLNSWWRPTVYTTTEVVTRAKVDNLYNTCSKGSVHPDFEITGQTLYEKFESLLQVNERYTDHKTAEAGFQNLVHKSAVLMFEQDDIAAGDWYFLNSKHIGLVRHATKWFERSPFQASTALGGDAKYALITSMGNLVVNNSARLAAATGFTAS